MSIHTITLADILPLIAIPLAVAVLYSLYKYRAQLLRALRIVLFLGSIGAVSAGAYYNWPSPQVIERVIKVEVPVPVKFEKKSAMHYARLEASKRGIPHVILDVIAQKEESTGKMNAIRYEAHHLTRYCGKYKLGSEEQRMCASSHGAFQIMAWHAYAEGKTYADLYDAEYNGTKAVEIIDNCRSKHAQVASKYDHYSKVFECYNGSTVYAKDAMEILARGIIEKSL